MSQQTCSIRMDVATNLLLKKVHQDGCRNKLVVQLGPSGWMSQQTCCAVGSIGMDGATNSVGLRKRSRSSASVVVQTLELEAFDGTADADLVFQYDYHHRP